MLDWLMFFDGTEEKKIEEKSIEEKEEEFNNVVREYIINLLTFIVLYICAYVVLKKFHQKKERDGLYGQDEDAKAHRISFYLCAFTLAVSIGSILMLPMSMIGNEIVHLFPESYWVQWLNGALIHTFWKWMFFLSNLSLFILLPFSYFFTESEGFSGQRRGLMPRVYETIAVLLLLALLVFGLAVLALAFFDNDDSAQDLILLVGEYYLQYLYSFLLGLCMLLIITGCAPLGFTILFHAVGEVLVKPKLFENNDEKIFAIKLEEEAIRRKLNSEAYLRRITSSEHATLKKSLEETRQARIKLQKRIKASALEKNLGYPLVMLVLLALTGLALFLVSFHVLKLIFIGDNEIHSNSVKDGFRRDYRRNVNQNPVCVKPDVPDTEKTTSSYLYSWFYSEEVVQKKVDDVCKPSSSFQESSQSLGANSLSSFGIFGTILEVVVILYLTVASVVGLYNIPGFRMLRPIVNETSMTKIILNCLLMQLVSSALPVLSRVLGFTNFELQGNFASLYWLSNFYVIFCSNVVFAGVTALCLVNKMTKKMRGDLFKALKVRTTPSNEKHTIYPGKTANGGPTMSPKRGSANHAPPAPKIIEKSEVESELNMNTSDLHAAAIELEQKVISFTDALQKNRNKVKRNESYEDEIPPSFCCSPSRTASLASRTFSELDSKAFA